MTIAPWWQRLPSRVLEEDRALSTLQANGAILKSYRWLRGPNDSPRVRVMLDLGDGIELEVHFPPHYPDECPSVRPVKYEGPVSSHQFTKTGVFCLELGPDNWHPDFTAADMVRSAWLLLAKEIISLVEPVEIPSRHVSTLAERISHASGVLLRTHAFDDLVGEVSESCEFEFVWPMRNLFRVLPVALPKGDSRLGKHPSMRHETASAGSFVVLRSDAPEKAPTDPTAFSDFVKEHGDVVFRDEVLGVLLKWGPEKTKGFLRLPKGVIPLEDMPFDPGDGARTPDAVRTAVASAKIAIVGLGSLGSKVVTSLARMGVRRFVLVDGDVLDGPNICRHAAGFSEVGAMKVDVARELIRDVSFGDPEIVCHAVDLASATNPDVHAAVLKDLGSADLLVDATANPEAFCILAMISSDHRRPLVWGEVFGGGVGGFIASANPGETPCARCVRAGFHAASTAWPPAPFARVVAPYDGGEEQPAVATDADVSFIAAALTNRVLDVMAQSNPSAPPVTLLGLRRSWIFDAPFASTHVHVRVDDRSCPRCWMPDSVPDGDVAARVEALFREANAQDSPAA